MSYIILRHGNFVSKSKGINGTSYAVPRSYRERISDGAFLSYTDAGSVLQTGYGGEKIEYTNRPPSQRGKSNLCRHEKWTRVYGGNPGQPVISNNSPFNFRQIDYGLHEFARERNSSLYQTGLDSLGLQNHGFYYLGTNGQALINSACADMKPDLTSLSVPNFLLEIEDIRKLFQIWKKSLSVARNLAGAHLNWEFGWKPMVSDLKNLVAAVTGLEEKLAAFIKEANCLFTQKKTMMTETLTNSGVATGPGNNYHKTQWNITLTRSATAHICWRPKVIQDLYSLQNSLRTIADALGFELNPSILWDALPFSFVIDWFFDVGSLLERFKIDTMELPIVYVDSYLQYHEDVDFVSRSIHHDGDPANVWWNETWSAEWITRRKLFHRMPLFPDYSTFTSNGWKFPSLNQALKGLSLVTVLRGSA
jgi:hypothetical protein